VSCYDNPAVVVIVVTRVANECHVWLSVSPDRMETLQVLEYPKVFTTDFEETRVHVVLTNQITSHQYESNIVYHHIMLIH